MPLKEKKISYREDWQRQHWHSLQSGYGNSPYFVYYADAILQCLQASPIYLLDLHMSLLELLLAWVGWDGHLSYSESYMPSNHYQRDYRRDFSPNLDALPFWFCSCSVSAGI